LQGNFLTYKDLDERANQLARFLEANGVKEEQPVGVMLERSLELMIAMLAVLKAGGAFVPMDPEYPAERLAIMAEDAEVPPPPLPPLLFHLLPFQSRVAWGLRPQPPRDFTKAGSAVSENSRLI
jgi:acyl-CoA synthetase (AMP-forming)/AMP-acid ligase II